MKNTRICDNYVLCFGCRCSCSCALLLLLLLLCVYFTHGLKISLVSYWTHCERWTKCTASVAYRKLNWNSTEAAVPSTGNDSGNGNGYGKASKAKRGEAMCARERGRQAGRRKAAAAAESNRGRHTHTHTQAAAALAAAQWRRTKRTNERTSEQRDHQIIHTAHTAQRCEQRSKSICRWESNRQAGSQPTTAAATATRRWRQQRRVKSRERRTANGEWAAHSTYKRKTVVANRLCTAAALCVCSMRGKIICVFAVAKTVMYQQIEWLAIWNYVQRACTVQSLNIGRALEVGLRRQNWINRLKSVGIVVGIEILLG